MTHLRNRRMVQWLVTALFEGLDEYQVYRHKESLYITLILGQPDIQCVSDLIVSFETKLKRNEAYLLPSLLN